MTPEQLENWFTYHDDPAAVPKYVKLRDAAHEFAKVINEVVPESADKTASIRKVREAVMTANAAIACQGK